MIIQMKRAGRLMERIVLLDNLREAFLLVIRGKQQSVEARRFRENLDRELAIMAERMQGGNYRFGKYYTFTIYDPKMRTICAAPLRDRVAMQAMMRICHPVFDSYQIFDSYASRPSKGTHKALERAVYFARRNEWFAKLDVRRFFYSVSHEVMLDQLEHLFKDRLLLEYFRQQINGYEDEQGRGLPIGNLTSQYFANHYLAEADHYLKEQLQARCVVRYMDDILLFAESRQELMRLIDEYRRFVEDRLRLRLHEPVVNRCAKGVPFLGYVIHTDRITLSLRSRRRFRQKLREMTNEYEHDKIDDRKYRERLTALYAFVQHADAKPLLRKIIEKEGFFP